MFVLYQNSFSAVTPHFLSSEAIPYETPAYESVTTTLYNNNYNTDNYDSEFDEFFLFTPPSPYYMESRPPNKFDEFGLKDHQEEVEEEVEEEASLYFLSVPPIPATPEGGDLRSPIPYVSPKPPGVPVFEESAPLLDPPPYYSPLQQHHPQPYFGSEDTYPNTPSNNIHFNTYFYPQANPNYSQFVPVHPEIRVYAPPPPVPSPATQAPTITTTTTTTTSRTFEGTAPLQHPHSPLQVPQSPQPGKPIRRAKTHPGVDPVKMKGEYPKKKSSVVSDNAPITTCTKIKKKEHSDDNEESSSSSDSEDPKLRVVQRRTRRRSPTKKRATPEQTAMLEAAFQSGMIPDPETRKKLAETVGFPERRVQIWFQNRRAKLRRGDKKSQVFIVNRGAEPFSKPKNE